MMNKTVHEMTQAELIQWLDAMEPRERLFTRVALLEAGILKISPPRTALLDMLRLP